MLHQFMANFLLYSLRLLLFSFLNLTLNLIFIFFSFYFGRIKGPLTSYHVFLRLLDELLLKIIHIKQVLYLPCMAGIQAAYNRPSIKYFLKDSVDQFKVALHISQDMTQECFLVVTISHDSDALTSLLQSIEL